MELIGMTYDAVEDRASWASVLACPAESVGAVGGVADVISPSLLASSCEHSYSFARSANVNPRNTSSGAFVAGRSTRSPTVGSSPSTSTAYRLSSARVRAVASEMAGYEPNVSHFGRPAQ